MTTGSFFNQVNKKGTVTTLSLRKGLTYYYVICTEGYIFFMFLFVPLFIHTSYPHVWKFQQVLVKVFQVRSGVYLSNHMSESIHRWTTMSKVTLEDWYSHHDSRPQGPCAWVWLVKSLEVLKCTTKTWLKFLKWCISQ